MLQLELGSSVVGRYRCSGQISCRQYGQALPRMALLAAVRTAETLLVELPTCTGMASVANRVASCHWPHETLSTLARVGGKVCHAHTCSSSWSMATDQRLPSPTARIGIGQYPWPAASTQLRQLRNGCVAAAPQHLHVAVITVVPLTSPPTSHCGQAMTRIALAAMYRQCDALDCDNLCYREHVHVIYQLETVL